MCNPKELLNKLSNVYSIDPKDFVAYYVCKNTSDVFKTFVATILSQNSTDKATYVAYNNLENKIGVTVDKILSISEDELKEVIKIVGLSNSKARYIKNIALFFKRNKIDELTRLPCDKLRELFLTVDGIGEKTADVVLVNCFKCKFFPVDTHIKRVMSRLGILGSKPQYKEIADFFISSLNEDELLELHQLLILHGRKTCTAKKPLCDKCVINYCCEYFSRMGKH
ncbi:endonuclease III domain-containing protein [Sulfurisphaera tokodaii]|uniref:DNA glycosylase/AP lyase n=2 Tax=Sulfurisphaera tokodaii TaxID=111955 RepID=F9VP50_SULTO|nr:endonuclease III domain-containing protein [Sulfurisphaera tokodaii]BAK54558.1 DNA glycosylase/AP lyase [Sulfurisphaera tokodaii str. 7]HII73714.1 endonuclease III domain-containing protein [Sulfurisphaera tokodaii]